MFDLGWDPAALPDPAGFEAVHVGSLGTALEPGAALVAELVVERRRPGSRGVVRSQRPAGGRARRRGVAPVFAAIAPHASIIKMSDEDAAVLFPGEELRELAVPAGRRPGHRRDHPGRRRSHRRRRSPTWSRCPGDVRVVDTIGAGDSFMAAMLSWCAMYDWPTGRRARRDRADRSGDVRVQRGSDHLFAARRRPAATRELTPLTASAKREVRSGAVEVGVRARGRRAALALVARAVLRRAVRVVGRRGQPEEADLADLHAGVELDRQRRDVRELERHVAGEARDR